MRRRRNVLEERECQGLVCIQSSGVCEGSQQSLGNIFSLDIFLIQTTFFPSLKIFLVMGPVLNHFIYYYYYSLLPPPPLISFEAAVCINLDLIWI